MSQRNPSGKSASSRKVDERFVFLSPDVRHPGKAFLDQVAI